MIGKRAAVLHNIDPLRRKRIGHFVVSDPELHPDGAGPRLHCENIGEVAGYIDATAKYVDDVDGPVDLGERRQHRMPGDGLSNLAWIDADYGVAVFAQVARDVRCWLQQVVVDSDHRDDASRLEKSDDFVAGRELGPI